MSGSLPATTVVQLERQGSRLYATINDPATRNAMTRALTDDLRAILRAVENDRSLRALVLQGANGAFCAGADLKGASRQQGEAVDAGAEDPLEASNREGGLLYAELNECPLTVIAVVDGPAFGGGFGMACCADIVIATPRARFALSETGLGIVPAQIAPFVINRIGPRHARRLGLTGARLNGEQAAAIGLADFYCPDEASLRQTLASLLNDIGRCAPGANAETKRLLRICHTMPLEEYRTVAAKSFAACARGPEGVEGVRAFAEKRPAAWVETV
ncbi:enoyl-CoA hydratase/isomerase family protein [Camelimonas abortus]|uniref:Enoyl-CoA hydratase/isomerase family protein n=1 Tax=Camelimonas abortus TaxID=1017184 RepID=A0ABV7LDY4_9HYPH